MQETKLSTRKRWKKGHSEHLQNNLSKGKFPFNQYHWLNLQSTMFLLLCKMCFSVLIMSVVIASLNVIATPSGCYLSSTQQQYLYLLLWLSCLLSLILKGWLKIIDDFSASFTNFSFLFLSGSEFLSGCELFHHFFEKQLYLLSALLSCEVIHSYWRVVMEYQFSSVIT